MLALLSQALRLLPVHRAERRVSQAQPFLVRYVQLARLPELSAQFLGEIALILRAVLRWGASTAVAQAKLDSVPDDSTRRFVRSFQRILTPLR